MVGRQVAQPPPGRGRRGSRVSRSSRLAASARRSPARPARSRAAGPRAGPRSPRSPRSRARPLADGEAGRGRGGAADEQRDRRQPEQLGRREGVGRGHPPAQARALGRGQRADRVAPLAAHPQRRYGWSPARRGAGSARAAPPGPGRAASQVLAGVEQQQQIAVGDPGEDARRAASDVRRTSAQVERAADHRAAAPGRDPVEADEDGLAARPRVSGGGRPRSPRRVLPIPPGPVSVSSRTSGRRSRSAISRISSARSTSSSRGSAGGWTAGAAARRCGPAGRSAASGRRPPRARRGRPAGGRAHRPAREPSPGRGRAGRRARAG